MERTQLKAALHENSPRLLAITLRPFESSDRDDFMAWASDDKVSYFCSWDTCTSKEECLKRIQEVMIPHPWCRAICIDNKPVGAISVSENTGESSCRSELSYALARKYWGKGIATNAVKMVVNTIFKEWPHLERLEAFADSENVGSQRVLEKVGFCKEAVLRKYCVLKGRTRDVVIFSVLSTDTHIM